MVKSVLVRTGVPAALLLLGLTACSSSKAPAPPAEAERAAPRPPPVADDRPVQVSTLDARDQAEMRNAWSYFVTRDFRWPAARDRWLAKGPAAAHVLAENLFRYFWSASGSNSRAEVGRVAQEAAIVGEPAVALWVKALVTDRWPLRQPITTKVFNPDNVKQPIEKTFTHYDIDNLTRQHAAYVLATIGEPVVPLVASPRVLASPLPSARRYGAYVLGAVGNDAAVAALGRMVATAPTWQDRGAAAKGLGFALRKNPAARPHLERALQDPDAFVRRKAQEGLDGRTNIEF